jgi:hypothetical protein
MQRRFLAGASRAPAKVGKGKKTSVQKVRERMSALSPAQRRALPTLEEYKALKKPEVEVLRDGTKIMWVHVRLCTYAGFGLWVRRPCVCVHGGCQAVRLGGPWSH